MSLIERVQKDMTAAMKARDELRLSALRMLKTALHNRKVEKNAELDDAEAISVVKSLVKQRRESVEEYKKGNRAEQAAREEKEIEILEAYLPAAVSEDTLRQAIEEAVQETGAAGPKDLGKVMKTVMGRFAGQNVDGKRVNQLARQRLAG